MYYFVKISGSVDRNSIGFGIFATLGFINRVDSLANWPIALLILGFYERRLLVLLKTAIVTALPIFIISLIMDCLYFGEF